MLCCSTPEKIQVEVVLSLDEAFISNTLKTCGMMSFHLVLLLLLSMEGEGLLDPVDEVNSFCSHLVFIPRINQLYINFEQNTITVP